MPALPAWPSASACVRLRCQPRRHAVTRSMRGSADVGDALDSPNIDSLDAWAFEPRRVDKPWGCELIWAQTEIYVGKVLFVRAGESLSLQFHREKDESWLVQS